LPQTLNDSFLQETSLKNLKNRKEFKRENSQLSKIILTAASSLNFFHVEHGTTADD
jgi:hypothetical protein